MLIVCFAYQGIVYKEIVPSGSIVNAGFYKNVFDRFCKIIARSVEKSVFILNNHFANIETIQEAVTEKIKNISESDFSLAMEKIGTRLGCLVCNGDYFEYKICLKHIFNFFVTSVAVVSEVMGRRIYYCPLN